MVESKLSSAQDATLKSDVLTQELRDAQPSSSTYFSQLPCASGQFKLSNSSTKDLPNPKLHLCPSPPKTSKPTKNLASPPSPRKRQIASKDVAFERIMLSSLEKPESNQNTTFSMTEAAKDYPPLLNPYTRGADGALISTKDTTSSPLHRIGSHFSPLATHLHIHPTRGGVHFLSPDMSHSTPHLKTSLTISSLGEQCGHPHLGHMNTTASDAIEIFDADGDDEQREILHDWVQRYHFYLENGIDDDTAVITINPEWINRVSHLATISSSQVASAPSAQMFLVMAQRYKHAIKKAIVDYLLLDHHTRVRLDMDKCHLVPLSHYEIWGRPRPLPLDPAPSWRLNKRRAKQSLEPKIMTVDPHIGALVYLWGDFHDVMLVDLPYVDRNSRTSEDLPPDLSTFKNEQLEYASQMKEKLMSEWYTQAKAILGHPKNQDLLDAALQNPKKYFDCVATLMSLQLRQVIVRSIQAYVAFFELASEHGPGLFLSLIYNTNCSRNNDDTLVKLSESVANIESTVLSVLYNIPSCLSRIERVETKFEPPLNCGGRPFLWNFGMQEDVIVNAKTRLIQILSKNLEPVLMMQHQYVQYRFLVTEESNLSQDSTLSEEVLELEPVVTTVEKYYVTSEEIAATMPNNNRGSSKFGLFFVDCTKANAALIDQANQIVSKILERFMDLISRLNLQVRQRYQNIMTSLMKKPNDLHDLVQSETYFEELKTVELIELTALATSIEEYLDYLLRLVYRTSFSTSKLGVLVPQDFLLSCIKTINWKQRIPSVISSGHDMLCNERSRIENAFLSKRSKFQSHMEEMGVQILNFSTKGDVRHASIYVQEIEKMHEKLVEARFLAKVIVEEESKLGWLPANHTLQMKALCDQLEPYDQLWTTVRNFKENHSKWLKTNIFELNAKDVVIQVQTMLSTADKVLHSFTIDHQYPETGGSSSLQQQQSQNQQTLSSLTNATAVSVGENIRSQLLEFQQEALGIITALSNEYLRHRHWTTIADVLGFSIDHETDQYSLQRLLSLDVQSKASQLNVIAEVASSEFLIEQELNLMIKECSAPNEKTKYHYCAGNSSDDHLVLHSDSVHEILTLVDLHMLCLQKLKSTAASRPFLEPILSWEQTLQSMAALTELIASVGALWQKIVSIYYIEEFIDMLPSPSNTNAQEKRNIAPEDGFLPADRQFKDLMHRVKSKSLCKDVLDIENVHVEFKQCHDKLSKLMQDVEVYLARKRAEYPKLYFLSDSELMQLLSISMKLSVSRTSDVLSTHVSLFQHLFPGLQRLILSPNETEILGMSSWNENLFFYSQVGLITTTAAKNDMGSDTVMNVGIEKWIQQLDTTLRTTMERQTKKCYDERSNNPLSIIWIQKYTEQHLLLVQQIIFTSMMQELALGDDHVNKTTKASFVTQLTEELQKYVQMMWTRDCSQRCRKVLQSLCIQTLYHREVLMTDSHANLNLEQNYPHFVSSKEKKSSQVHIQWMDQSYLYGFEYLGNQSEKMVITPLTLRCFQSLMLSMKVGKSSVLLGCSVKHNMNLIQELSAWCGRKSWFISGISSQFSISNMTRILRGIVSSGVWLCLTQIEKLKPQDLNDFTQLCFEIQQQQHHDVSSSILVGGVELHVQLPGAAIFGTTMGNLMSSSSQSQHSNHLTRTAFRSIPITFPNTSYVCATLIESYGFSSTLLLPKFEDAWKLWCTKYRQKLMSITWTSLDSIVLLRQLLHQMTQWKKCSQKQDDAREGEGDEGQDHEQQVEDLWHTFCKATSSQVREDLLSNYHQELDLIFKQNSSSRLDQEPSTLSEELSNMCEARWIHSTTSALVRRMEDLYAALHHYPGVILSGLAQSGKSTMLSTLSKTLNHCHDTSTSLDSSSHHFCNPDNNGQGVIPHAIQSYTVNPLMFTAEECYGRMVTSSTNGDTYDDGIVANVLRKAMASENKVETWMIVDTCDLGSGGNDQNSLLAENLSSLLLNDRHHQCHYECKSTGERIRPSLNQFKIVFEVETILECSPSLLVSCGLIHLNSPVVSDEMLLDMWCEATFNDSNIEAFQELEDHIIDMCQLYLMPCQAFITRVPFQDWISGEGMQLRQQNFFRVYSHLLSYYADKCQECSSKQLQTLVECLFVQSLVWGLGNCTSREERMKFNEFLCQDLLPSTFFLPPLTTSLSNTSSSTMIEALTLYDYTLVIEWGLKWIPVLERTSSLTTSRSSSSLDSRFNSNTNWANIVIPTTQSSSITWFLTNLNVQSQHVLLYGPADNGKSLLLSNWHSQLKTDSSKEPHLISLIPCSDSTTTASLLATFGQHIDRQKQDHQQEISLLSDPNRIYFVDDLSLCVLSTPTSSSLECLRYSIDSQQYFDLKTMNFYSFQNFAIHGTWTTSTASTTRNNRLLRHFIRLGTLEVEVNDIMAIYTGAWNSLKVEDSQQQNQSEWTKYRSLILQGMAQVWTWMKEQNVLASSRLQRNDLKKWKFRQCQLFRLLQRLFQFPMTKDTPKSVVARLFCFEVNHMIGSIVDLVRLGNEKISASYDQTLQDIGMRYFGLSLDLFIGSKHHHQQRSSFSSQVQEIQFQYSLITTVEGKYVEHPTDSYKEWSSNEKDQCKNLFHEKVKYTMKERPSRMETVLINFFRLLNIFQAPFFHPTLLVGQNGVGKETLVKSVTQFRDNFSFEKLQLQNPHSHLRTIILNIHHQLLDEENDDTDEQDDEEYNDAIDKDEKPKKKRRHQKKIILFVKDDDGTIVTTEQEKVTLWKSISDFVQGNYQQLLSPADVETIGFQMNILSSEDIFSIIQQRIQKQLKLVIAINDQERNDEFWKFPKIVNHCTTMYIHPWTDEDYSEIGKTIIQNNFEYAKRNSICDLKEKDLCFGPAQEVMASSLAKLTPAFRSFSAVTVMDGVSSPSRKIIGGKNSSLSHLKLFVSLIPFITQSFVQKTLPQSTYKDSIGIIQHQVMMVPTEEEESHSYIQIEDDLMQKIQPWLAKWQHILESSSEQQIWGDWLLLSAVMQYFGQKVAPGVADQHKRMRKMMNQMEFILQQWKDEMKELDIPYSADKTLIELIRFYSTSLKVPLLLRSSPSFSSTDAHQKGDRQKSIRKQIDTKSDENQAVVELIHLIIRASVLSSSSWEIIVSSEYLKGSYLESIDFDSSFPTDAVYSSVQWQSEVKQDGSAISLFTSPDSMIAVDEEDRSITTEKNQFHFQLFPTSKTIESILRYRIQQKGLVGLQEKETKEEVGLNVQQLELQLLTTLQSYHQQQEQQLVRQEKGLSQEQIIFLQNLLQKISSSLSMVPEAAQTVEDSTSSVPKPVEIFIQTFVDLFDTLNSLSHDDDTQFITLDILDAMFEWIPFFFSSTSFDCYQDWNKIFNSQVLEKAGLNTSTLQLVCDFIQHAFSARALDPQSISIESASPFSFSTNAAIEKYPADQYNQNLDAMKNQDWLEHFRFSIDSDKILAAWMEDEHTSTSKSSFYQVLYGELKGYEIIVRFLQHQNSTFTGDHPFESLSLASWFTQWNYPMHWQSLKDRVEYFEQQWIQKMIVTPADQNDSHVPVLPSTLTVESILSGADLSMFLFQHPFLSAVEQFVANAHPPLCSPSTQVRLEYTLEPPSCSHPVDSTTTWKLIYPNLILRQKCSDPLLHQVPILDKQVTLVIHAADITSSRANDDPQCDEQTIVNCPIIRHSDMKKDDVSFLLEVPLLIVNPEDNHHWVLIDNQRGVL